MKKQFLSLFLLLLAPASLFAQTVEQDASIRQGKLKNGLTYYIRHNAKEAGLADFYIAQRVGSILEEPRQRGLAHFLEHMAFNGTKHFPGKGKQLGIVPWCCETHSPAGCGGAEALPASPPPPPRSRRFSRLRQRYAAGRRGTLRSSDLQKKAVACAFLLSARKKQNRRPRVF